ncbi:MAG TPA: glycosyltransferase, partial [Pyrinomonadaceae bacterium]|nr:glycosyltransferase [Pyrinomonadaceae bacterium]
ASEICKSRNDARFVIVGRDNSTGQEFRRDLRRLARTLGIENSVLFLDWLDSTDEFFSAIDLFVSASHFESFGLAMAEAMAFAKPVAATDTAGSRELLPDDALAEPQSPLSLCKIILDKLDDPYRLQIEGDRNKSRILENYSLEKMVLDTEKLYSKILR